MPDESPIAAAADNASAGPQARWVDRHRKPVGAIAVLVIVSVAAYLTWFYWPTPEYWPPVFAWYTVDNGASWFQDDAERIPPFDHEGKPAVRLHLFTCDGGKTTFVGYLQKLPEEAFKKYRDKGIDPAKVDDDELAAAAGWLVKRPADAEWVNSLGNSTAYRAIVDVRCPDGAPVEVFPKNPPRK